MQQKVAREVGTLIVRGHGVLHVPLKPKSRDSAGLSQLELLVLMVWEEGMVRKGEGQGDK